MVLDYNAKIDIENMFEWVYAILIKKKKVRNK